MYIYNTKLICFSIFVLISLTVNSLCMHDWHPKRPLILSSNVQQVLPLPVSACASSLLASPDQAWLRSVCRASLVCGFAHALLHSQADCAGTSPWSIPPQKSHFCTVAIDNHLTPRWELISNNAWETLKSNGRECWRPTYKTHLTWNFRDVG